MAGSSQVDEYDDTMLSDNEQESVRERDWLALILLGMIYIAFILAIILAIRFLFVKPKESRSTSQQAIPMVSLPTVSQAAVNPAGQYSMYLPVVLTNSGPESGMAAQPEPILMSVPVAEQIWKVTRVKTGGYEFAGQNYDMAVFTRIDGQLREKGYCLNPGWDIPAIGTEYLLTAKGIFVPVEEPEGDPIQHFQMIR